jgi:hypothetical protein
MWSVVQKVVWDSARRQCSEGRKEEAGWKRWAGKHEQIDALKRAW